MQCYLTSGRARHKCNYAHLRVLIYGYLGLRLRQVWYPAVDSQVFDWAVRSHLGQRLTRTELMSEHPHGQRSSTG